MHPDLIRVGTSGWVFDDWAGAFYPLRVPRSRWLEYYAARFPIGELNSTYYRIAPAKTYAAISRKTPDHFRLFAKVHADVTHTRCDALASLRQLLDALKPVQEAGKLAGLLAQFPGEFHYADANLDYALRLQDDCRPLPLAVEFRNRSWLRDDVHERLRAAGITWVCPDEPALPDLLPLRLLATTELLYIRLHGRNSRTWYHPQTGDRYDYDYSPDELTAIAKTALEHAGTAKQIFVYFNNCHAGQAARNAQWLMLWLQSIGGDADDGDSANGLLVS